VLLCDRFRTRRRWPALVLALAMLAAACGDDDDSDSESGDDAGPDVDVAELLGPENAATGEPVNVGVVSTGRTSAIDNSEQIPVAEAAATYANEHLGGLAGHEINVVGCETENTPEGATDCINQFLQEDVVAIVAPEIGEEAQIATAALDAGVPYLASSAGSTEVLLASGGAYSLTGSIVSLSGGVGAHMLEEGLESVAAIVIDVPTSTQAFEGFVVPAFEEAGLSVDLVTVAPGTADMTPDIESAEQDDPDAYWIFGDDRFCVAAAEGVETLAIDKPLYYLPNCLSTAFTDAIDPSGAYTSAVTNRDPDDEEAQLYTAVLDEYAPDVDQSNMTTSSVYVAMLGLVRALEGTTGDLTPESVDAAVQAAADVPAPLGGGNTFACDGTAGPPPFTGLCSTYGYITPLDSDGQATDYVDVDISEIFG
jgi:branched-chain amino acid transport system substrate-binding protein